VSVSKEATMAGYFPPDSMARNALSQRAVGLTYGQRALTIGATHPRLFQGTAQSTTHRDRPFTRLSLTARLFEAVFLGSREEADRALAFTAKRHVPVHGRIERAGGPHHPAGASYDAHDPGLMWWTVAFTLDSVEHQYDELVRRLTDHERERLFADFVTWAELFGMPREAAPTDYAAYRSRFDAYLASDEPYLTEEARLVGRYVSGYVVPNAPPLPARPFFAGIHLLVVGSLPERVRELFEMKWTVADRAAYAAATRGSRLAHRRPVATLGAPVLRGRSREFYAVVARGERAVLRRGRPSMPGVSDRVPA